MGSKQGQAAMIQQGPACIVTAFLAIALPVIANASTRSDARTCALAPPNIIDLSEHAVERRLTATDHEHGLTNANVWTRDSQWVGYDIRENNEASFNAVRVEMTNICTGERRVLFHARNGAGCGVVTFSPADDLAAFIMGPEHPDTGWDYAISRRRGVVVSIHTPDEEHALDAMNYAPPFTPGALRGGSHVHMFSPDGKWISFTYDDDILVRLDEDASAGKTVPAHDRNQRNIAVATSEKPIFVAKSHPRNHNGNYFSALVSRTVNKPRLGSDEISRAFEEAWIGENGYIKADGSRQHRALAFQGLVTAANGKQHAEVFVADIPDDITRAGDRPLAGTETRRPAPPKGTMQRRLTRTDTQKYPGISEHPRHWLRCAPDGGAIGFIMKDNDGINQFWTISPRGGSPVQITRLKNCSGIASAFTWNPDGRLVAAIADGSVCIIEIATGRVARLTPRRAGGNEPAEQVSIFSPDGKHIAYLRKYKTTAYHRKHVFIVNVPLEYIL